MSYTYTYIHVILAFCQLSTLSSFTHSRGICSNEVNDPVKKRLDRFFAPLADSYIEICKQQERQFYGLRDFYRYHIIVSHFSPIPFFAFSVLLRCCTGCVRIKQNEGQCAYVLPLSIQLHCQYSSINQTSLKCFNSSFSDALAMHRAQPL